MPGENSPVCGTRYYRIDRRQVHLMKFVLEGYDGLAVMRTVDPRQGLVALHIPPGCEADVDMIIEDLRGHMRIEAADVVGKETP